VINEAASKRRIVLDREQAALLRELAAVWSELQLGVKPVFLSLMSWETGCDSALSPWTVPADPAFFAALNEALDLAEQVYGPHLFGDTPALSLTSSPQSPPADRKNRRAWARRPARFAVRAAEQGKRCLAPSRILRASG
jgi:hypothetical protein